MAHGSLTQYLQQVDNSFRSKNGKIMSDLLSCRHNHVLNSRLHVEKPQSFVERMLEHPLDEIVSAHIRCLWALSYHDFVKANNAQMMVVQGFIKLFQTQRDENWSLPVLYTVCLDMRLLALRASQQYSRIPGQKPKQTVEKAAECLMSCFRVCAADNRSSEEYTKRWGMLNLVNQLFKVYFQINKLHLCKPLIRAIESSPFKENFALSQLITYKFYVGRKAMFDNDYKSADAYLSFAFERCHRRCWKNKRLILIYLVPVKILLGFMPTRRVLEKYDLLQYWDIIETIKVGNYWAFKRALENNLQFFMSTGCYLILEKFKVITLRNLFKRVYLLLNTHQVPIESLLIALKLMEVEDIDSHETVCLVANFIFDGKIKGYLSHVHQKLVVSKQNPFPKQSTLN